MSTNDIETKQRNREYDYIFKIVIVGDAGVGKSQLLSRFSRNEFSLKGRSTIGVEFATKIIEMDGKLVCIQVWDTSGDERYRTVASTYYRGAAGALVVYDITRSPTFESAQEWIGEIKRYATSVGDHKPVSEQTEETSFTNKAITTMIVGNKLDLRSQRTVETIDAQNLARSEKMFFTEASALDSTNVEKAFLTIVREIFDNVRKREPQHTALPESGLESGSKMLTVMPPKAAVVEVQPKKTPETLGDRELLQGRRERLVQSLVLLVWLSTMIRVLQSYSISSNTGIIRPFPL